MKVRFFNRQIKISCVWNCPKNSFISLRNRQDLNPDHIIICCIQQMAIILTVHFSNTILVTDDRINQMRNEKRVFGRLKRFFLKRRVFALVLSPFWLCLVQVSRFYFVWYKRNRHKNIFLLFLDIDCSLLARIGSISCGINELLCFINSWHTSRVKMWDLVYCCPFLGQLPMYHYQLPV